MAIAGELQKVASREPGPSATNCLGTVPPMIVCWSKSKNQEQHQKYRHVREEQRRSLGGEDAKKWRRRYAIDEVKLTPWSIIAWISPRRHHLWMQWHSITEWYLNGQLWSHLQLHFLRSRRQKWKDSGCCKPRNHRWPQNVELVVWSRELHHLKKGGQLLRLLQPNGDYTTTVRITTTNSLVWLACCRMAGASTAIPNQ